MTKQTLDEVKVLQEIVTLQAEVRIPTHVGH